MSVDDKLAQILARTEQLQASRFALRSTEAGLVHLADVCFVESLGSKRIQYVTADGRQWPAPGLIKHVEDALVALPNFVRTSRGNLVNMDRVTRVSTDPAGKGYLLSFRDLQRQALVSSEPDSSDETPYVNAVTDYLELTTLDHITPFNDTARALRDMQIESFPDPATDDLRLQPAEFYLSRFADGAGHFSVIRFVRNTIWQSYCWIRDGVRPPFEGLIRSFWYSHVKPVLGRLDVPEAHGDKSAVVNKVLTEMVVTHGLFHYWEMGFTDDGEKYRLVGTTNPHVILFTEKEGLFPVVEKAHREKGVTVLAFGGSPNRITTDFLVRDLKQKFDIKKTPVYLFGYTDYDPQGTLRIAFPFQKQLHQAGFPKENIRLLYHITQPANFDPRELQYLKVPMTDSTDTKRWVARGYGIIEGRKVYGLVADSMLPARVREVFYREAAPYLRA